MTEVQTFLSEDPRLDWFSEHDPRSMDFPIRSLIGKVEERPKFHKTGAVLDQGREGACVGFGWCGELLASPKPNYAVTAEHGNPIAQTFYREFQKIDGIPYAHEGTSVLAGAKKITEYGYQDGFRWALGIEDVRDAVIAEGPVVIGIPWYESMYETRDSGLVEVGGSIVGGHCILLTGYHPGMRLRGEPWKERIRGFRWRNSWGEWYGVNGDGFVRYEDLRDLLADYGEACVPVGRKRVRL